MTKIFIAQAMKGIPEDEIALVRKTILDEVNYELPADSQMRLIEIPTYKDVDDSELCVLGSAIQSLQDADFVVFAPGWQDDPACQVYWTVCNVYGLRYIDFEQVYL